MDNIPIGAVCKTASRKWPFEHYAVCVGRDSRGMPTFVHGVLPKATRASFEEALGTSYAVVSLPQSAAHAQEIVERAEALIGTPYELFTKNCQHIATEAATGTPSSPQVVGGIAAGLGLIGLALAVNNNGTYVDDAGRRRDGSSGQFASTLLTKLVKAFD